MKINETDWRRLVLAMAVAANSLVIVQIKLQQYHGTQQRIHLACQVELLGGDPGNVVCPPGTHLPGKPPPSRHPSPRTSATPAAVSPGSSDASPAAGGYASRSPAAATRRPSPADGSPGPVVSSRPTSGTPPADPSALCVVLSTFLPLCLL